MCDYQSELSKHINTIHDGIFDSNITVYDQLQSFNTCVQTLINDNNIATSSKFTIVNAYYNMKVRTDNGSSTDQTTLLYFVLHQIKKNKMDSKVVNLCWIIYDALLDNNALPSITPLVSSTKSIKKRSKYKYSFELCRLLRIILDKCDDVTQVQTAQKVIKTLQHSCDDKGNVLLPSVLSYVGKCFTSNASYRYYDYGSNNYYDPITYFDGIYDELPPFDVLQEFINSEFFYNEYFPLMQCWKTKNRNKRIKFEEEEKDKFIKDLVNKSNSLWNILFIRDLFGDFMYKQMFNTLSTSSMDLHEEYGFPVLYDNVIHAVLSYWFKSDFLFLYEEDIECIMLKKILSNIHKMDNESIHWFLDNSIEYMLQKHKDTKLPLNADYYFNLYKKKTYSLDVLERLLPFFISSIKNNQCIMLLAKGIKSDTIIDIFTNVNNMHMPRNILCKLWLNKNKYNECCNLFEFMKYSNYKKNKNMRRILRYFAAQQHVWFHKVDMRLLFNHFFKYYINKERDLNAWDNMQFFVKQLLFKKNQKVNKVCLEQYISRMLMYGNIEAFEMLIDNNYLKVVKLIKNKHIYEMMKLVIPRVVIECDESTVAFFERIMMWMISKRNDKNKKWIAKFFCIWTENAKGCEDNRWYEILLNCNNICKQMN